MVDEIYSLWMKSGWNPFMMMLTMRMLVNVGVPWQICLYVWKVLFIIEMWIHIILVECFNYFNMQQNPIVFKTHLEMIVKLSIWKFDNHLPKSYYNHNGFISWPICPLTIVDTRIFIKIMPYCA
jgi:hypothetical protein